MKTYLSVVLGVLVTGCTLSSPKSSEKNLSDAQVRLEQRVEQRRFDYHGSDKTDIMKNEVQSEFLKWVDAYFIDTLNRDLDGFRMQVSMIGVGFFNPLDVWFIRIQLEDELFIEYYQEVNFDTEQEMQAHPLYEKLKHITEEANVMFYGYVDRIEDYNRTTANRSGLPRIIVGIDSLAVVN